MERSEGQQLGLEQLEAIAAASDGALRLGAITEPTPGSPRLRVEASLDCSHIERSSSGILLRGRERFSVRIPVTFPYDYPEAYSVHRRWRGTPHVHFAHLLCLYQAPSEWEAHAGMYGFMQRLELWLTRAAEGDLDPDDGPLHPPIEYGRSGTILIVQADCPAVDQTVWTGFAQMRERSPSLFDITAWRSQIPDGLSAFTMLLPRPLTWEYPETVEALFDAAAEQGLDRDRLYDMLMAMCVLHDAGTPLRFVVGAPMRRGHDGRPRQHLSVWELDAGLADDLALSFPRSGDGSDLADARARLRAAVMRLADLEQIKWCHVIENRPEIVVRRDETAAVTQVFAGKTVAIWGCGAIGSHAAHWLTRVGIARLILYDNDIVTPGVLVRQDYADGDIGLAKSQRLAERLRAVAPMVDIETRFVNVLLGPLSEENWHDDADFLIDATASANVRLRLEQVRRDIPCPNTTIIALLFGHDAERGLAVSTPPAHPDGPEGALRQLKIMSASDPLLSGFADEFWPSSPRTDHFQPEPGCSDTTFRGSAVEVVALTSNLLQSVATQLRSQTADDVAGAHLFALPAASHVGRRSFSAEIPPAVQIADGLGRYEIRLSQRALVEIRGWSCRNDRVNAPADETGGVLLGRRDETTGVVWIDSATGPPPDSIASPERFECGIEGVADCVAERLERTRNETAYLGMWHTHPQMPATPSETDLHGMFSLVAGTEIRDAVMLIVGGVARDEQLGAYVFNGDKLRSNGYARVRITPDLVDVTSAPVPPRDIGLALSGGGTRALAFHLGCLRALHDRGVLQRVKVLSGVSGGALMSALYAYRHGSFEEFDARAVELLRRGLFRNIVRRSLFSRRMPQSVATIAVAGMSSSVAFAASSVTRNPSEGAPLRRWKSRTDAFEDVLRSVLGEVRIDEQRLDDELEVVINACDLRTGSAFRFGSRRTASSYLGQLTQQPELATAVAASAAYPVMLPALDRTWEFERPGGDRSEERVILPYGCVYDNSGTSVFRGGASVDEQLNVFDVDYVIACDAGRGTLAPKSPFNLATRTNRAFEVSFRKLQDASRGHLHDERDAGNLAGFAMPYLGQQDHNLPWIPPDLVRREQVAAYPTNFSAMNPEDVRRLTLRGEQLTRLLIERWCPDL